MNDTVNKWIEAGYKTFAFEGPAGVQVEKLARDLQMNKSGFYHHFGDREVFFARIMDYHDAQVDLFCRELGQINAFDPGYYRLAVKYKTGMFFHAQLRRNYSDPLFATDFRKFITKTEKVIIPLWARHINISGRPDIAKQIWDVMRNGFFVSLSKDTYNEEFLRKHIESFISLLDDYYKERFRSTGKASLKMH